MNIFKMYFLFAIITITSTSSWSAHIEASGDSEASTCIESKENVLRSVLRKRKQPDSCPQTPNKIRKTDLTQCVSPVKRTLKRPKHTDITQKIATPEALQEFLGMDQFRKDCYWNEVKQNWWNLVRNISQKNENRLNQRSLIKAVLTEVNNGRVPEGEGISEILDFLSQLEEHQIAELQAEIDEETLSQENTLKNRKILLENQ